MAVELVELPLLARLGVEGRRGGVAAAGPARPAWRRGNERARSLRASLASRTVPCRRRCRPAAMRAARLLVRATTVCVARSTSRRTSSSAGRAQAGRARRPCPAGRDLRPLRPPRRPASRRDHGRQLRVAELLQQAEHVAVDRLLPDVVAVAEVAADAGGVDPRVERRRRRGPACRLRPSRSRRSWASCLRRRRPCANQSTPASTFCTS